MIVFHDKCNSGYEVFAKTNQYGLAQIDYIQKNRWRWSSSEDFSIYGGKPGFDPIVLCDNPPDELLHTEELRNGCTFYCIVPAGTNRETVKGHKHENFSQGIPISQDDLKSEWTDYKVFLQQK